MRTRGESLFSLPDPAFSETLVEGSLVVRADGPGVVGTITFGDPIQGRFRATSPLVPNATNLVFPHIAQGDNGTGVPYFTGLALFNPSSSDAVLTIEVYSDQGARTATTRMVLSPQGRIARTLPQIFPSLTQQRGGYVRVTSADTPIVVLELLGDDRLESLVAVPAQFVAP